MDIGLTTLQEDDIAKHIPAAHALVLVNHGNDSGEQILELANEVRRAVQTRFGILLEPEPLIIRSANPSAIAVLPTPGSPIKTGLFLVLRDST